VELFTGLHLANRSMVVPAPIVDEVGYLLGRYAGARTEAGFLRSLADGDFETRKLTSGDYARAAELVEQYADMPLGTSDAAVIALSERLGVSEVATLDRRHFIVVRPRHVRAFTLLP
jgi:predicted nucleic acid-binding protein